jgi:hypothetical protein
MSFDDLLNARLVIKRLTPVLTSTEETLGGTDTTLLADTASGDRSFNVPPDSHIIVESYLRLGDESETETVVVDSIVDVEVDHVVVYSTVTLTTPLLLPHDSGDQVREVDGAGTGSLNDDGYPVTAPATVATVDGRIRPLRANEVALLSQAGAVVSTLACDLYPVAGLGTDCWIECDGVRYDINSMPDAAGEGHHLVLGVTAVA